VNEEALPYWGLSPQNQTNKQTNKKESACNGSLGNTRVSLYRQIQDEEGNGFEEEKGRRDRIGGLEKLKKERVLKGGTEK
jgi:hypothetical protein